MRQSRLGTFGPGGQRPVPPTGPGRLSDENGFAFPGQETLVARARLCVRQTRRHLTGLQAAGELLILDRPGCSNLYVVLSGASRRTVAAALDRATAFGARTGVPGARVAIPDARVAIPDALLPTAAARRRLSRWQPVAAARGTGPNAGGTARSEAQPCPRGQWHVPN